MYTKIFGVECVFVKQSHILKNIESWINILFSLIYFWIEIGAKSPNRDVGWLNPPDEAIQAGYKKGNQSWDKIQNIPKRNNVMFGNLSKSGQCWKYFKRAKLLEYDILVLYSERWRQSWWWRNEMNRLLTVIIVKMTMMGRKLSKTELKLPELVVGGI